MLRPRKPISVLCQFSTWSTVYMEEWFWCGQEREKLLLSFHFELEIDTLW